MQDRELYRQILGIESPWYVARVDLQLNQGEIHVYLGHDEEVEWPCPECQKACTLFDHQPERQWRHLDTCQYKTVLHAPVPRSDCAEHGVRVVKLPWAEAGSRFTLLFEAIAIEWLKQASQKAVADQMKLSWHEIHGIMKRAVQRGLKRRQLEKICRIGIDEKAFRTGYSYMTLVNDLERGCVLYVAEGREQSSLDPFWSSLSEEQLNGIEAIAMDMWEAYLNSIRAHVPCPETKVVFDKFHIAQHLGEAVDEVRRAEQKHLRAIGDNRLTGTRYQWLKNPKRLKPTERRQFAELRRSHLKTARAYALRQAAMTLFEYFYSGPARKHFHWWHSWAVRCRLKPMKKVAEMMKRRFENIITFVQHRITNATSESINAKIQWVKYTARGFRNKANFKDAVYFHAGGLNMAPSTHSKP
jgi:transposase